ncbi:phosphatidylinositol-4- kinase [Binucleata daphniae]
MLSFDQSKYKQLFKVIEFVMLSKDLLIREDLMVDLIKHIITNLKKINNKEMSKLHLLLLLNTNAIIYLSKKSKNEVFLHLIDNEILSEDEKYKVIKETDYSVEVNLIFDIKNKTVKAESNIEIIAVFLEYLSFQSSSFYFNEYNTIFEKHMKHKNCIEFYANFLARNELELPLWNYLPNKEIEEAVNFFTVFFKKIKTNYDKKYKNSKKKKDFSVLLEKHVISFCYFFLKQKNELLVPVLNTFPFLPCKHDYLYIYYDIWCFILNNEMIREVLFFAYKTPPFVNIAESFYTKHMPTQYLKGTIFRRYKKEVSSDSFSYENIEKHCSSFFMCIIYFVEYEKVRNFNFTGILAYIKDAELIKYCFNDFRYVLKLIHYKLKYNEEYLFLCEYTLCLLETFDYPFESTKVYILDILELLYKNYRMIVYDVNVNIKYNSVISSYYQSKTRNNVIFDRLVKFYKTCYIEVIKDNSKFYYNYLLACVCDFSIFNEYSCFGKGRFLDLIKDANSKFYMINKFASTIKQEYNTCKNDNNNNNNTANNINVTNDDVNIEHSATPSLVNILSEFNTLLYAHENNKFTENVSWFIDVVYLYRNETSVLRKTIKILQKRLNILYNYDDLFVILKIYNILGIREEETEHLVRRSLSKGVDYNIDYDLLKQLSEQTEDFFTFYFYNLYFISSLNYNQDKFLNFPTKKTVFTTFSKSDLIKIHNVYRRKITFDLLNTSIFSHREYFVDTNSLSVMDILMILMFCSKKEFTEPALTELRNKEVLFYIPQIVQTLKKGKFFIEIFLVLMELCKDVHVCHFLIWNLKSNLSKECEIFKRCLKDLEDFCMKQEGKSNDNDRDNVRGINDRNYIGKNVSSNMEGKNIGGKNVGGKNVGGKNVGGKNVDNVTFDSPYTAQMNFFSALTNVSSLMMPFIKREKEEKRKQINRFLSIVEQPKNVYLPTDPSYEILGIVPDSGKVLQSHAKVPFMASFYCRSFDTAKNNEVVVKNLIFKSGDDCRQDMLAIQLITLFKDIFKNANIDLFLFPYKVIATDTDSGIIEVIPNAITRDQMGREKINNLVEYFEFKYGYKEGLPFKKAVNNFTKSLAGYSLVTYFLNIADRHNGNIMIDDEGHIIHIDFGFMFEIAPGIGIEIPLKLTKEVYDLLSIGNMFEKYIDLMIKGFFALRRNSKDIIFMVDSFKDSGLPCYKKNAVENFIGRFKFGLNDDEAKTYVKSMITGSIRKVRTWVYDKFQEVTNNIAF